MKTLKFCLPLMISMVCCASASAQIQQGSFRIGGAVSYAYTRYENDQSADQHFTSLSLNPSLAYFAIDNLSIGLAFPATFSAGEYDYATTSSASYQVGPEVRYYFPFGKFALFPTVSYAFGKLVNEIDYSDILGDPPPMKTESNTSDLTTGLGTTYFITPNIGVEALLLYHKIKSEYNNSISGSSKSSTINFSIGFQVYLNRKQ